MLFLFALTIVSGFFCVADPTPGITFIENKHQWPDQVDFSTRVPGGRMYIEPGSFTYYFLDEKQLEELHHHTHKQSQESSELSSEINGRTVKVDFIGANKLAVPLSFGKSSFYHNYFIGSDTCHWASKAYGYSGLIYPSLYNGIDLKVYGEGTNVKYDFIVAPQADPSTIQLDYSGTEHLYLNESGDLEVTTYLTDIIEKKPIAYQYIEGKKVLVPCRYILNGNKVSFSFSSGYDPCYELIIDPLLIFSTYSGSTADNWGSSATPGEHGNLYSAGVTNLSSYSGNFPATAGAFQVSYGGIYDVAILKYDSAGQDLLYASYLGGTNTESPHSLVMNSSDELVLIGTTGSVDFPTTINAIDRSFNGGTGTGGVVTYNRGTDIFVARLSTDGSKLLAGTYLGGSQNDGVNPQFGLLDKNYGDQLRGDVITDEDDNIYLSSMSSSPNFPLVNPIQPTYGGGVTDAVLVKLNPALTAITWSTYLGGIGADASLTIKFDRNKNIFLAGGTSSVDFPVSADAYQTTLAGNVDGWIATMDNGGTHLIRSTFTGTPAFDQIYFLDLNLNDEVYIYGQTSGNFPITAGVYNNPGSGQFIQKFNASLTGLIFSTVFGSGGGVPDISPTAFLVNECNNLYLAGWGGVVNIVSEHWQSNTLGMPVTPDAFQRTTSGSDFYFMVLTDDASQFLYGTYLGGTQSRTHVDGGTSRFDKNGIVYHAVCSGCDAYNETNHSTSDFPTTTHAWSRTNNSRNCNNAAFKFDLSSLKARLQSNSVKLNMPGLNRVCMPDSIVFQNLCTGGETFVWDLGDGTRITKLDTTMVLHQYKSTGTYIVWLKAIDKGTCKVQDSAFIKVDVFLVDTYVQGDDDLCLNASYQLKSGGGAVYSWVSEDNSFQSDLPTPLVNPRDTTRYFITITESYGCVKKDTVQLNVIPLIKPDFEIDQTVECLERPSITVNSITDSLRTGDRLYFDFGDGSTSEETSVEHPYEKNGVYTLKLVGVREFCVTEKTLSLPLFSMLVPNIITPGRPDGSNDKFTIQYGDVPGITPAAYDLKTSVVIYNRWGGKVYQSDDYQYDWDGDGLAAGVYFFEVTVDGHGLCKSWLQLVK